jgi:hypothetical protein
VGYSAQSTNGNAPPPWPAVAVRDLVALDVSGYVSGSIDVGVGSEYRQQLATLRRVQPSAMPNVNRALG